MSLRLLLGGGAGVSGLATGGQHESATVSANTDVRSEITSGWVAFYQDVTCFFLIHNIALCDLVFPTLVYRRELSQLVFPTRNERLFRVMAGLLQERLEKTRSWSMRGHLDSIKRPWLVTFSWDAVRDNDILLVAAGVLTCETTGSTATRRKSFAQRFRLARQRPTTDGGHEVHCSRALRRANTSLTWPLGHRTTLQPSRRALVGCLG